MMDLVIVQILHCSGLPDRTTLRPSPGGAGGRLDSTLFRSSRPDYIETRRRRGIGIGRFPTLFRSSRPDYIETHRTLGR